MRAPGLCVDSTVIGPNFRRISLSRCFSIPGRQWLLLTAALPGVADKFASIPAPAAMIIKVKQVLRIKISVLAPSSPSAVDRIDLHGAECQRSRTTNFQQLQYFREFEESDVATERSCAPSLFFDGATLMGFIGAVAIALLSIRMSAANSVS
jgi:hypothetical protein